ncbi:hypothetical protein Plhal710r2_c030g0113441 [Plasmopara halstedii]
MRTVVHYCSMMNTARKRFAHEMISKNFKWTFWASIFKDHPVHPYVMLSQRITRVLSLLVEYNFNVKLIVIFLSWTTIICTIGSARHF